MRHVAIVVAMFGMLSAACVTAQQREVVYFEDFEADVGHFISADPAAEIGVTQDPEHVFSGERSLELDYVQAPIRPDVRDWGFPGAIFLPTPDGAADVGEVAFALKTKLATPIVVILTEGEDGPRYSSMLWSRADTWQQYSLTLDEFTPDLEGPDDPNGKLDPGQVSGLVIADGHSLVRMIAESSPLFHVEPAAEQTLWLDEFAARAGQPEAAPEIDQEPLVRYSPPMRELFTVGGRDVSIASEEQADGAFALRVDYTIPATTLFGVLHSIRPGALSEGSALRFHTRTHRDVTLLVVLEERRGPGETGVSRYQTMVPLEPSDDFEMVTLPLSLFELGDDQTDPNGELDADLVNLLSIVDATAIIENSEVLNTLRLKAPVVVE